ncbi:MAG: cell envelope integrity protein TolA [Pseudomonadota bacterium]
MMSTSDTSTHTVLAKDLLPVARASEDRLPPMMFVATLFYALVILGVSFDIGMLPDSSDVTSLEVTIVAADSNAARPDDAQFQAQNNQQGAGNTTERARATAAPAAPGQVPVPMERVGEVQIAASPGEEIPEQVLTTTADAAEQAYRPEDITDQPDEVARVAQALPQGLEETLPLPVDDLPSLMVHDENPRHLIVSLNVARSDIAPYVSNWKQRVERIGTLNFPRELRIDGLTGDPLIAVTILPDGSLDQIELLRSSGHVPLDQAAMTVLTRASPFAAFPPEVLENYELLTIRMNFEFRGGRLRGSASVADDG